MIKGRAFKQTSITPLIIDVFIKERLAKLGYTFDGNELSDFDVELAMIVGMTKESVKAEEMSKAFKKNKMGR